MNIKYVLYDGRYHNNPDNAYCYTMADTLKEAKEDKEMFTDAVIVKYDEKEGSLTNPRVVNCL